MSGLIQRTWQRPAWQTLTGQHVSLTRLQTDADASQLFACSHGMPESDWLWRYMSKGPFANETAMRAWLQTVESSQDPLFYTVCLAGDGARVGQVSIMNIVPDMGRAELGNIWYAPAVQKSRVNTEAIYLCLRGLFDELGYRRVEWKCNALNAESRRAALRLGFSFEGIFRQHMVIKGVNRDTAWFGMMDHEWPTVKRNFERYFTASDLSLAALNKPIIERGSTVTER